jgi:thymidine phosphorylase
VKTGSGAFMADIESARELAKSLVAVANGAGLKTSALITDMNEPLASCAGNAVEVLNAVAYLVGARQREPRLHEVVIALAAEMLVLGGLAESVPDGDTMARQALTSGAAADRFQKMVTALGGPADFVTDPMRYLPQAKVVISVPPEGEGVVSSIDTRALGLAVVSLGGGRTRAEDPIDHSVGLTDLAGLGDEVGPVKALALVHARDEESAAAAGKAVRAAYTLGNPPQRRLVYERIGA